ncbi:MAG: AraC family transcriptional regulator [Clostridiales bacterium]|nr:AraC family transcriptional regulator [Clostridiales bacterium]
MVIDKLELLFQFTGIPMQLYDSETLKLDLARVKFSYAPLSLFASQLNRQPAAIGYTVTKEQLFIGYANISNSSEKILIGPTSSFKPSQQLAETFAKSNGVPIHYIPRLLNYLQSIPACSIERSIALLRTLNLIFNGEDKIAPASFSLELNSEYVNHQRALEEAVIFPIDHKDDFLERELLSFVEFGQTGQLRIALDELGKQIGTVPAISDDADRAFKNIVIFATGVVSRTALKAGLDYDTIDEICTYYLNKVEFLHGYTAVFDLFCNMFMNFANQINMLNNNSCSPLVMKIKRVISGSLHEKVTPTLIAKDINMNISYLCRAFKKETGKTISTYINEQKVRECMRLLTATELSISEISVQLEFSSCAHMITLFKRITDKTPNEYRNQR